MDENGGHYIHQQHRKVSNADPSRIVAHATQIVACAAVSQFTLSVATPWDSNPAFCERVGNFLVRNSQLRIVSFDVCLDHLQRASGNRVKEAVIQNPQVRNPRLQVLRQVLSQVPVASMRCGELDHVPENSFFNPRQFVRHMSGHHLDPTNRPSVCQHNGPGRAHLGLVEVRDFKSAAPRTSLRERRKPPRRRQGDVAAQVRAHEHHDGCSFTGRKQ
jgi:hypothetical protein